MISSVDHGSSSSSSSSRPSKLIKVAQVWEFGCPAPENKISSPVAFNMVSNSHGFSYSRFGNVDADFSAQDIGWDRGNLENTAERPYMIRWKSGKKVDQRLLMLLESFFQEIYVKRRDFFEKIFPGKQQDEFKDVFRKIGSMLRKNNDEVKTHTLQRSLSVGSPRRPQRFKIKTPAAVIRNPDGRGGATASKAATG